MNSDANMATQNKVTQQNVNARYVAVMWIFLKKNTPGTFPTDNMRLSTEFITGLSTSSRDNIQGKLDLLYILLLVMTLCILQGVLPVIISDLYRVPDILVKMTIKLS